MSTARAALSAHAELKRMTELEVEHAKLTRVSADLTLKYATLNGVLSRQL